jgi:hypothetical protein
VFHAKPNADALNTNAMESCESASDASQSDESLNEEEDGYLIRHPEIGWEKRLHGI